jgi:8-oxo-dGTP pyrophosphatase MutT (NUDIX family)
LVVEAHDPVKQETFYRPLGGGIEFGETSKATVVREIREEIGAEIADLRYIGTLENIFTYNGADGHEIVQIYDARFVDEALYAASRILGVESDGEPIHIVWKPLGHFSAEHPLYPDGLLDLLSAKPRAA